MKLHRIIAIAAAAFMAVPIFSSAAESEASPRVVGYLPDWNYKPFSDIDLSELTHINIAFCNPDNSGRISCDIPDNKLKSIISAAHSNNVEVFAALGGGDGCDGYLQHLDTPEERTAFNANIMDYCETYDFDGIDLDIELGSNHQIWNYYADWCTELRTLCDERDMEMSTATAQWVAEKVTPDTFALFNFVNVMAYDNDEDERSYQRLNQNTYIFEAKTLLSDFRKIMQLPEDTFDDVAPDADTLAGLLLEIKGEFPQEHERITHNRFTFEVMEVDERRILKIKVIVGKAVAPAVVR